MSHEVFKIIILFYVKTNTFYGERNISLNLFQRVFTILFTKLYVSERYERLI